MPQFIGSYRGFLSHILLDSPISVCRQCFNFCNGSFQDAEKLEEILNHFGNASGMLINHQKSTLIDF
jgi:hypothetical protein